MLEVVDAELADADDWYSFQPDSDEPWDHRLLLEYASGWGDLHIAVYNSRGDQLVTGRGRLDSQRNEGRLLLEFGAEPGETVFLRVYGAELVESEGNGVVTTSGQRAINPDYSLFVSIGYRCSNCVFS